MSKRKKRNNSPDLPQAALERARQQANEPEKEASSTAERRNERRRAKREEREPSSRRSQPETISYSQRNKKGEMDSETIQHMLAHPTRIVSEEELQGEYQYVLNDIRSMFILAAGLMVALVILAQFI